MVEMALITPILLLLILGVFQAGLVVLTRMELTHAAQEAAAAAAREPIEANRCAVADSTIVAVYPQPLTSSECDPTLVEVTLVDGVLMVAPFGPFTVSVTARSVVP